MGVFAAGGLTAVATTTADAAPAHPQTPSRTVHSISFTVPGTGVRMTSDLDDDGNVVATSAGDDEGDEVGIDDNGVDLGDENDAAEAVDDQGEDNSDQDEAGDDQGEDNNDQGEAGDDQGEDNNDQGEAGDDQGDDDGQDEAGDDQGGDSEDQGDSVSSGDSSGHDSGDDEGDDDGGDSGDD
jgi:hypothetical protein